MKKIRPKHQIKVRNGRPQFSNLERFYDDLRGFEGMDAYITIQEYRFKRSDAQNRYYWGVVVKMIADYAGYFIDEVHEALKLKFLPTKEVLVAGQKYLVASSTASLNTAEFEEYVSKIRIWADTELEIKIPEPNEVNY